MLNPMPPLTIKRKDPLLKAVRRSATRQLDVAIASLTGEHPDHPKARRELLRLQALLHLVRRPLTREVFSREHRVVTRSLKLLPSATPSPRQTLTDLAAIEPKLDATDALARLDQADQSPTPKRRQPPGPDPKLLRLVADLAEMRMRARYWHLPDGGFELLAPGLRQSYQQAAKLSVSAQSPREWAAACGRLADQLQALERAWPEQLSALRKTLRTLEHHAHQQADLTALRPALLDHADLLARLDDQIAQHDAATQPRRSQFFVETPTAFAKRLAGVWHAWRQ